MAIAIDIVIPVKNRDTVEIVVETILREIEWAPTVALNQILLCDGGSTEPECLEQIDAAGKLQGVTVLRYEQSEFNKGWLLNRGLEESTAQIVLMSDADVLWQAEVLEAIALHAVNYPTQICSISNVKESQQGTKAIRRQRYTYRIEKKETEMMVEICADRAQNDKQRPGCGIVCAQRQAFETIGGYKEDFSGWGWEDQDFLIRAQLLGYEIATVGEVTHLSHGDAQRNSSGRAVEESRDRNILRCLESLKNGRLVGDWVQGKPALSSHRISVKYPHGLGANL